MDYKTIMELDPVAAFLQTMWVETDDGSGDPTASGRASGQMILDMVRANWGVAPETIASAATTDIGASESALVNISGGTTITSFGVAPAGTERFVGFNAALTLTHSGALILPGSKNIRTAVGDVAKLVSLGAGNWVCIAYNRAAVSPVVGQQWNVIGSSGDPFSVTGSLAEVYMATITIPGGALGPRGQVRVSAQVSAAASNANAKNVRLRFGGNPFTIVSVASTRTVEFSRRIANRGATNVQVSYPSGNQSQGAIGSAPATLAVDTTADFTVALTCTLGDIADTVTLDSYLVEYCYGA